MGVARFPQGPLVDLKTGLMTLEWMMWFQNPEVQSIIFTDPLPVSSGGTGLSEGISGGIPGFIATDEMASSLELEESHIVLGGGSGATPYTLSSSGTSTQVLHGNASGDPTWSSVSMSDLTGVLPIEKGGTNSGTALTSNQTIMIANGTAIVQGPTGTSSVVLHGGNPPSYGKVLADEILLVDDTTNNASETQHGFLKKLSGNATDFLNGEGDWVAAGDSDTSWVPTVDGSEPPVFITDGAGNLVFTAYTP